ncbi:hypothetical protein CA51_11280 [Rosistilla oblonga]|uniref:Uncharacterized protein n=1 Tax=Rosistilla oblonga TaxID=2527990 RepID=A0A518IQ23_9BACT|nr:hypothetical protein [Rosistilla oblonga]QDV11266.1 hypothetical protein CA51_11280 [Rosistilla oblonga]QDV55172.1 hypothetical protein Mal33_11420 [Rosistilla oblonga]
MEIVIQILLGLSVIGFGVLMWKSAERWTWVPLVIAPIVFIEAVVFMGLVAMSSKSRVAWQKISVELEERLDKATVEEEELKYGVIGLEGDQRAVVPIELALQKLRVEAGRVWRGLSPQGAAQGQFTLNMPQNQAAAAAVDPAAEPADPAAAPADGAESSAIPVDTIVFAFSEVMDPNQNRVPQTFLGQYLVTQSSPQSLTLQPLRALSALSKRQQQGISQAQSWAIYEVMPLDGHEPFFVEASRKRDEAIFGDADEEFLNAALAGKIPAEVLQSYLKDGKQAQSDDPPEAKWRKIKLLKDHSVIVDGSGQRTATEGSYFDLLGQAVDSRLQLADGDEVQFKAGTELVFKYEEATELISTGVAELIDEIYVRPLNDYDEIERHVFERLDVLAEKVVVLNREIAIMKKVKEANDTMLVSGQEDKLKLEAELAQHRVEKAAIEAYAKELQQRKAAMRTQLAALYQDNVKIVRNLERVQMQLKQQIDQRTAAAGL